MMNWWSVGSGALQERDDLPRPWSGYQGGSSSALQPHQQAGPPSRPWGWSPPWSLQQAVPRAGAQWRRVWQVAALQNTQFRGKSWQVEWAGKTGNSPLLHWVPLSSPSLISQSAMNKLLELNITARISGWLTETEYSSESSHLSLFSLSLSLIK